MQHVPLAFIGNIGVPELLVVGFIALLLFGKRLPDVARSLGNSFTQFKKGLNDPADEDSYTQQSRPVPRDEPAPRKD